MKDDSEDGKPANEAWLEKDGRLEEGISGQQVAHLPIDKISQGYLERNSDSLQRP